MPYIKEKERIYDEILDDIQYSIVTKGDLNYFICELVARRILQGKISYTTISNWIDTVHDAEAELRRRLLDPYEDLKIQENGDVPSFITILDIMKE